MHLKKEFSMAFDLWTNLFIENTYTPQVEIIVIKVIDQKAQWATKETS